MKAKDSRSCSKQHNKKGAINSFHGLILRIRVVATLSSGQESEPREFRVHFYTRQSIFKPICVSGGNHFRLTGAMQNSGVQSKMRFPIATEHGCATRHHRTLNRLE
jgi:hypothetical protein